MSAYWEAKDTFSSFYGTSFEVAKLSNLGEVVILWILKYNIILTCITGSTMHASNKKCYYTKDRSQHWRCQVPKTYYRYTPNLFTPGNNII